MSLRTFLARVLGAACIALSPALAFAQSQEDETDVHGYDKVRIEQEDKLLVPPERVEEVWKFLVARLVDDKQFLTSLDPAFTSSWSEELFHDTYYDTPSMQMYAKQSSVRHRKRESISNPLDRKSGRELMQIKLNDISSNELERAEIKFEIEYPTGALTGDDAHPLLGIVKPSMRAQLQQRLADIGVDARSMKPVLTVRDLRHRVYILKNGKAFMSISHDQASSSVWWSRTHFCELEPELNEIGFTESDPETRRYMETVLAKVVGEIHAKFPDVQRNLTPKYNKSFDGLEQELPFFRTLVRVGMQGTEGMLLVLCALALLALLAFALVRRSLKRRRALEPVGLAT